MLEWDNFQRLAAPTATLSAVILCMEHGAKLILCLLLNIFLDKTIRQDTEDEVIFIPHKQLR